MRRFFLFAAVAIFLSWSCCSAQAAETAAVDEAAKNASVAAVIASSATSAAELAQQLSVGDPQVLPDSPWYWAKDLWRGLKSVATFNPAAKAEYRLQVANERLVELQKMAENGDLSIEQAVESLKKYAGEINKLQAKLEQAKEKSQERVNQFLNQYGEQELVRQKLMMRLEEKLGVQKLEQARERSLEKLGQAFTNNLDQAGLVERWQAILANQSTAENLDNLEILQDFTRQLPERLQGNMEQVQTVVLSKVSQALVELKPEQQQEMVQNFLANGEMVREKIAERLIASSTSQQLKNQIRAVTKESEQLRQELKLNLQNKEENCLCTKIYSPVCGQNGQTYGNACEAKCADVAVQVRGQCAQNQNLGKDNNSASSNQEQSGESGQQNDRPAIYDSGPQKR